MTDSERVTWAALAILVMFYVLNLQAFFARGKRNQLQSVEMPLNMRGKVLEKASAVMHVSLKNDQSENGCDSLQKG